MGLKFLSMATMMLATKDVSDHSGDRFNNFLSPTFDNHENVVNINVAEKNSLLVPTKKLESQ